MTRFSNPASDAAAAAQAYARTMLGVIGAHDLVHRRQLDRILASV